MSENPVYDPEMGTADETFKFVQDDILSSFIYDSIPVALRNTYISHHLPGVII